MGQLVAGGWTQDQSDALKKLVMTEGKSYAQAAILINEQFGTSYTRNSAIGRANRLGMQSPFKQDRKPQVARVRKPKVEHHTVTRIVRANSNSNAMRVVQSVVTEYKLRCVEIVPRNISLIDLEKNDCRYPYGDGPITFCGHPKRDGSSFCTPHHFLCWEQPRRLTEKYFVQGAAA